MPSNSLTNRLPSAMLLAGSLTMSGCAELNAFTSDGFYLYGAAIDGQPIMTEARNTVWLAGWLSPQIKDDVKTLHRELYDSYEAATVGALDELGVSYTKVPASNTSNVGTEDDPREFHEYGFFRIDAPEYGCEPYIGDNQSKPRSTCEIQIRAGGLEQLEAPAATPTAGQHGWSFRYENEHHIRLTAADTTFPEREFYQKVSAELMQGIYLFQPRTADEYPFWYHQGNRVEMAPSQ